MLPVERFLQFVLDNELLKDSDRTLLAVSGGKDSVLMAHLFHHAGLKFAIAHCNFNLRGEDSDFDERFVRTLADEFKIPCHAIKFDTKKRAEEDKISIQMAARVLRYEWFEEIRTQFGYDSISVAHHQNDFTETILLNLVRGTGISGLHGILPKRGKIIRPLLFLTREEIDEVVAAEKLEFREDQSNLSSKYARNKIRLEVIPKLKELNPILEQTFRENGRRFSELEEFLRIKVEELRNELFIPFRSESYTIDLHRLKQLKPINLLLYELFKPFLFNEDVLNDLVKSWDGQSGKQYQSATHQITLDRERLLLTPREVASAQRTKLNHGESAINFSGYDITILELVPNEIRFEKGREVAYFDADLLVFPLLFRNWQKGDYFYPLGLKGKKKLSDYFTNLKIPIVEKTNIPILENGNGDIIWIAGYRTDERYKILPTTQKVIKLEIVRKYG